MGSYICGTSKTLRTRTAPSPRRGGMMRSSLPETGSLPSSDPNALWVKSHPLTNQSVPSTPAQPTRTSTASTTAKWPEPGGRCRWPRGEWKRPKLICQRQKREWGNWTWHWSTWPEETSETFRSVKPRSPRQKEILCNWRDKSKSRRDNLTRSSLNYPMLNNVKSPYDHPKNFESLLIPPPPFLSNYLSDYKLSMTFILANG